MSQKLTQIQQQKLEQQQLLRLSQQQILALRLLEMPIAKLEEDLEAVMDDNPALEKDYDNDNLTINEASDDDNYDDSENEDYQDELNRAFDDMSKDDDMEDFDDGNKSSNTDVLFDIQGNTTSFYDNLIEQMNETVLTEQQRVIMEYLIGSLDTDGLLHKQIDVIIDELAIYHYIETTKEEILDVLKKLQTFEPIGIGARTLQECLLLQIEHKPSSENRELMKEIITNYYDSFINKHWNKIQTELHLSDDYLHSIINALRKLNPKPGASMGETIGVNNDQITPDIIIEKDDEGHVSFSINHGNMPELKISDDYLDEIKAYNNIDEKKINPSEREAKSYYKEKVEKANWYIDAIRQRYQTMTLCTKAIIKWQHKYFIDGDESELKPMILKDIAEKTGLDISTVSRFSNQKYAETPWGIRPMRFFFTDSYTTSEGEELATRKIKMKLKEIIEEEDKKHPLSDEILAKEMAKIGFPIARRTIAKYREQMNIPIARLRK